MILVLDKNKVNSLPSGQILSFQDSEQSGDINFGVRTGNINTPSQITVNYSNPNDLGQTTLNTTYTIPIEYTSGNTTNVDNPFPADVEYFQVITGMTIGDFASIANPDANDFSFDGVFARQVEALGKKGDVLIAISTSGSSKNCLIAIEQAKKQGLKTLGFTKLGGEIAQKVDISIQVPSNDTQHIQECHLISYHIIAGIVEELMSSGSANWKIY